MEYSNFNESFTEMTFDPDSVYQNLDSAQEENQMPPPGFERTGNRVPLTPDELIAGVKEQLRLYDHNPNQSTNPYQDPVIYTTAQGNQVQVPAPLQIKAIEEWMQQKEVMRSQMLQSRLPQSRLLQTPQTPQTLQTLQTLQTPQVPNPDLVPEFTQEPETTSSHIIWILIGMAVMYFLLTRNSQTQPVYAAVL